MAPPTHTVPFLPFLPFSFLLSLSLSLSLSLLLLLYELKRSVRSSPTTTDVVAVVVVVLYPGLGGWVERGQRKPDYTFVLRRLHFRLRQTLSTRHEQQQQQQQQQFEMQLKNRPVHVN